MMLPDGWDRARIHEISELVTSGSRGWARYYADSGAAFVRVGNILRGQITLSTLDLQRVRPPIGAEGQRTRLVEGDVLVTITADLGRVCVYRSEVDESYINQHIALVRLFEGALPPYVAWYLVSPEGQRQLLEMDKGITKAGLTLDDIKGVIVPFAPLSEQRRIVAKLDDLTAPTARARGDIDRVPALAERQRRAVLRAAFAGNLTNDLRDPAKGLAESGWRATTLGELCDVQSGLALGKKRAPGARTTLRPYLRVANVQRGWLRLDEVKWMDVTDDEFRRLRLQEGDILMNEGGDLDKLGRGWVWQGEVPDCVHQNHVFRLRLRDPSFPPEYVSHYANELGQKYVLDAGKQTTNLASISKSRVCAMPIVMPPHKEAHEIVRRIDHAFTEIDRLVSEAAAARRLLDRLDQAILAKAFRGELVPQEPNNEPASVLLDRIRAERAPPRIVRSSRAARRSTKLPAGESKMSKSRLDDDVRSKPYLAGILRQSGPLMTTETLFKASDLPIADFYKQLDWEIEAGHIAETGESLRAA